MTRRVLPVNTARSVSFPLDSSFFLFFFSFLSSGTRRHYDYRFSFFPFPPLFSFFPLILALFNDAAAAAENQTATPDSLGRQSRPSLIDKRRPDRNEADKLLCSYSSEPSKSGATLCRIHNHVGVATVFGSLPLLMTSFAITGNFEHSAARISLT